MYNCKFCNKKCKNNISLSQHQLRCTSNPNKKRMDGEYNPMYGRTGKNKFIKCKELGIDYIPTKKEIEGRKISIKYLKKANKIRWSKDGASEHMSKKIKEAIKRNPDSYSSNNISGRVKCYDIMDSFGNKTKVKGTWELLIANFLNELNIKWINKIDPIKYYWNNKQHLYFPDFYLPDFNYYIEVKGYQRDRDLAKWKSLSNLIIIKHKEIKAIKENNCDMAEWLMAHLS